MSTHTDTPRHISQLMRVTVIAVTVLAITGLAAGVVASESTTTAENGLTVSDQEVSLGDETEIVILSNDTAAVNVATIPDGWNVSDISDDGDFLGTGEVNWDLGDRADRKLSFVLEPPADAKPGETLELTVLNDQAETETLTVTVVAPTPEVADQEVSVDEGSPVTISAKYAASINVDTIPEGWNVSEISDGGAFLDTGEVNWDFGDRADREVNFTLVPPQNANVGETIELAAVNDFGKSTPFNVTIAQAEHESGVDREVADSVAQFTADENEEDPEITGGDMTILRGKLLDGETKLGQGVAVSGADYTILRGWLLDR